MERRSVASATGSALVDERLRPSLRRTSGAGAPGAVASEDRAELHGGVWGLRELA